MTEPKPPTKIEKQDSTGAWGDWLTNIHPSNVERLLRRARANNPTMTFRPA